MCCAGSGVSVGETDVRPRIPWHKTLIYELHVKGFTARHPDVSPEGMRGDLCRFDQPAVLSRPGLTGDYDGGTDAGASICHRHAIWWIRGFTNYWGYNSDRFLCARRPLCQSMACTGNRWQSLKRWSIFSIARASRSSWMSSIIILPKAITWGRPLLSRDRQYGVLSPGGR